MEFQVRYLTLFFLFWVIDGFAWFWMGSLHKNIQLMLEFPKGPFLVLHFSYYTLMPSWWQYLWYCYLCWWYYSKCDQASDLWQQLELASELELVDHKTLWTLAGLWLVDFNAEKTDLVLCDEMDGSVLEEKSYFKMLWLSFSFKLA